MKGVPFLALTFACFTSACADPAASKPIAQTAEPANNTAVASSGLKCIVSAGKADDSIRDDVDQA